MDGLDPSTGFDNATLSDAFGAAGDPTNDLNVVGVFALAVRQIPSARAEICRPSAMRR